MNKNRENFKKYSNDLYFHHLLVENEGIRTLICQELILDREIVSTKLKNAQQYGKNFYEKKLILDILAIDDVGDLYNIELQTYGLNEEILVRFELYNAELLRQQVKQGEDYTSAHVVRSLIISYGHILDNAPLYKCHFRMVDDEHHIVYPFNRMEITIIQLEYINQVINEMTSFNQLMYLFKNEKPYDKIEIDYRIKEAIQMHDKYISSEESYLEYLDRLDNEILLRSRDRKIKEANQKVEEEKQKAEEANQKAEKEKQKAEEANQRAEKVNNEIDSILDETKESIIKYIKMQFHEDISDFISTFSKQQIRNLQKHLYDFEEFEELKGLEVRTISWTKRNKEKKNMAYTEQEKERALALYDELGSIGKVINQLGYPTRQNMYTWIKNRNISFKQRAAVDYCDSPTHRRHPTLEMKLNILHRCFEIGEDIKSVSEDTGYSRASIYSWRRKYLNGGAGALMSQKKHLPRGELTAETASTVDANQDNLMAKVKELEFENDILKETIKILKKDQGIDLLMLKNKEKTMIVDTLRSKYSLSKLLEKMHISKSSYCYQHKHLYSTNKYEPIKEKIIELFNENSERYGYRRIQALLRKDNIQISEKIVRKIMKENNLIVKTKKTKKYNSYQGEISKAVDNFLNRNFHAERPNEKMLTDITEFSIPAGKVYLSPIIDCFDGMVTTWNVSTKPDADLVNQMLDTYYFSLANGEKPLIHSDRGAHYRWPGWIERMNKYGFKRSMSKKGCSPDNSACEGFFGRMKNEMFYGRKWENINIEDFITIINEYILWYNTKRIKKSLNYMSPSEYRQNLNLA
jgi:putative transposase